MGALSRTAEAAFVKEKATATPEEPTRNSAARPPTRESKAGDSGEAYSAFRGRRPIPAALQTPFRLTLYRDRRPSLCLQGKTPCPRRKYRDDMALCQIKILKASG